ncbi:MAG TPA: homoserine O-succinyltransferase [Candidatus Dormibacteraeota bacterium]|nr:homoserine O-succinyltransferase [Candidatus Dormibacteraeota bacterium]
MLHVMDESRTPPHWAARNHPHCSKSSVPIYCGSEQAIEIALVNNMPDPALEDTESQFFELLEISAGYLPVRVKLYSLPKIPRGERGKEHLRKFYWDLDDLWNSRFDGIIVTGTEPQHADLREEPYWSAMVDVFAWAEEHTPSAVLSCLAAHAGVLDADGIPRYRKPDKQFGVFDERKVHDHLLTTGTSEPMRFPHSRWNEVREDALTACGYTVLTRSAEAGVNLFIKKRKKSLFVYFQGHPEYAAGTLSKEYRRDVKRFLRHERETYPNLPHQYFDAEATKLLNQFRERAIADRQEELMTQFPEAVMINRSESPWQSPAICVYRNWLQYVVSKRSENVVYASVAPSRAWAT